MPEFGQAIRHYWQLEDCSFLNHGSFGATPIKVLEAQQRWQYQIECQPVYFMGEVLEKALREAANCLAQYVGGQSQNLVFVDNATTGVNTVLRSFPWQPGDRIFATSHSYGAIRKALYFLRDRYQLELTEIAIPFPLTDRAEILEVLQKAFSIGNAAPPKLLVVDHISSPTGLIFPIDAIVDLAHSAAIPVLVDGAHAPGMLNLKLDTLCADWYVGNCHKWLCAPKGCAFLYTHPDRQEITHPLTISHGYSAGYLSEFSWMGTRDFSSWLAVTAAIDFQQELGTTHIQQYIYDLLWRSAQYLCALWDVPFSPSPHLLGAMATLPLPASCAHLAAATLHDLLWHQYRIEVPIIPFADRNWLRISTQVYNTFSEYERLGAAVLAIGNNAHQG